MMFWKSAPFFLIATIGVTSVVFSQEATPTANKNSTRKNRVVPNEIAARAGTAIHWETEYEQALARAQRENRPVFWYVPAVPGTFMDRQSEIDRYMLAGPFSWPAMIKLINERTIPFRGVPSESQTQQFNLQVYEFVEPGFLLIDTKQKPLLVADRMTTLNPLELYQSLASVLGDKQSWDDRDGVLNSKLLGECYLPNSLPNPISDVPALEPEPNLGKSLLLGMVYFQQGRQQLAKETWDQAARRFPDHPLAWKAACEAQGIGPFVRGFEVFSPISQRLVGSDHPLRLTSAAAPEQFTEPEIWKRSIRFLLAMQDESGGYFDSDYDFGGSDGLPNVHVAITSLVGMALLEAEKRCTSEVLTREIRASIEKAALFVANDKNLNFDDRDEILWALAYRIRLLALLKQRWGNSPLTDSLQRASRQLEGLQLENGSWYHEYPNSFASATALSALHDARQAGAEVSSDRVESGLQRLASQRFRNGAYPYAVRRPEADAPEHASEDQLKASSGRIPICELARHVWGQIHDQELAAAVEQSLEFHDLMAKALKYDDHTSTLAYGGFFFWYDMQGRSEAISRIADATVRQRLAAQQRALIRQLPELDGCFVDSHELGRCYGTAMALLSLSAIESDPVVIE